MIRLGLAAAATTLVLAGAAVAQQQTPAPAAPPPPPDFSKVEIKTTDLGDNVYMLEGQNPGSIGGNITVAVAKDGIIMVDGQYAPLHDKIKAAVATLSNLPIKYLINTHYHGDHTGGNEFFQKQAPIIAQDNVRKRLEAGGEAGNGGSVKFDQKAAAKGALPIITFDHDVTVHLNGEDIRALHFPAGHTDGDSIIYFPKSNVVHMGDDFVTYGFPFIDVSAGGSIGGMIDGVEKAIAQLPADVKIIPGHGPVSNLDDVRAYVKMLKETRAVVQDSLKKKMTLAQMKEKKLLDPWKKYSGDFISSDAFLETLYNSLTGQKNGTFIKHN